MPETSKKRQKLSRAQLRQRRAAGRSRAKQFTSESQSRAGKAGARVTMERHGLGYMLEMARQHRLRNPTRLELQMIGVLGALKLAYEREFVVCKTRMMTVDFMLPACNLAIEVHGGMHDQGKPDYRRRLQNDTDKRALLDAQNRRVLTLHHSEFKDLAGVIERVKREVQGDHSTAN